MSEEGRSSASTLLDLPRATHLEKQLSAILPAADCNTIGTGFNGNVAVFLSYGLRMGYQAGDRYRNTR